MFYKDIKKSGKLIPSINKDDITIKLDEIINRLAGRAIRGNCVYLSCDIQAMDGFERSFRVSTKNIDTSKLFVADNSILDDIIATYGTDLATVYAYRYIQSYMSYDDFIKNKDEYMITYRPEFLYFGEIGIKRTA